MWLSQRPAKMKVKAAGYRPPGGLKGGIKGGVKGGVKSDPHAGGIKKRKPAPVRVVADSTSSDSSDSSDENSSGNNV